MSTHLEFVFTFVSDMLAERLYVTEGTIKNHMSSILGKLGVRDRTQAVLKAKELGLA